VGVVIMLYPESPNFYYRQLTLPMPYMPESSTFYYRHPTTTHVQRNA